MMLLSCLCQLFVRFYERDLPGKEAHILWRSRSLPRWLSWRWIDCARITSVFATSSFMSNVIIFLSFDCINVLALHVWVEILFALPGKHKAHRRRRTRPSTASKNSTMWSLKVSAGRCLCFHLQFPPGLWMNNQQAPETSPHPPQPTNHWLSSSPYVFTVHTFSSKELLESCIPEGLLNTTFKSCAGTFRLDFLPL